MHTPEEYRKRAVFLRKLADEAMTEALQVSYRALAANWDALAEEADGKAMQNGLGQDPLPDG
ncbi:MAG TPA: hypothetical protein VJQ06_01910 [Rhizomicrobium sp.]|nr:hypothetical protein [Rhizomicrobium sp.]